MPGHEGSPYRSKEDFLNELCTYEGYHVIAYSMGARLALEALLTKGAPFASLSCISTTLEIENKSLRQKQENTWIEDLSKHSLETFIDNWYAQPLFDGFSPPPHRYNQDKDNLIKILIEYSILNAGPLLSKLSKQPVQFLYKTKDPKANPIKDHPRLHYITAKSHAIHLENPGECIEVCINYINALNSCAKE